MILSYGITNHVINDVNATVLNWHTCKYKRHVFTLYAMLYWRVNHYSIAPRGNTVWLQTVNI